MKTAVSIPDDVFEGAERLAQKTRKSRSQLYSDALREYVSRHSTDEAIEAWNSVIERVKPVADGFGTEAARRTLEQSEW